MADRPPPVTARSSRPPAVETAGLTKVFGDGPVAGKTVLVTGGTGAFGSAPVNGFGSIFIGGIEFDDGTDQPATAGGLNPYGEIAATTHTVSLRGSLLI